MEYGETNNFANRGLPLEEMINLGERLSSFYKRFSQCFRTQTRDTSEYGLKYISGQLRMCAWKQIATWQMLAGRPKHRDRTRNILSVTHLTQVNFFK
jgi:hypothetical protein